MLKASILVFTIWSNAPDGHQTVLQAVPMDATACVAAQNAFYTVPFPSVGKDDLGEIPAMDAACVPVGS